MSQLKDVGCYHYSPWRFLGRKERCDKGWGHIGPHRGRHTHKRWDEYDRSIRGEGEYEGPLFEGDGYNPGTRG